MWRYCGSARSARITSMPSRDRHVHVEQHEVERSRCARGRSASSPSAADVTSKPALPSDMRTMSRIDGESSAARMRIMPRLPAAAADEQRFDAEQARSVADDARVAEPLDLALAARRGRARTRTAAASWKCRRARRCRRRALHGSASSRCRHSDCFSSAASFTLQLAGEHESWAARPPRVGSLDNRSDGRCRALSLRLLGTHRARSRRISQIPLRYRHLRGSCFSARNIAQAPRPAAAKLLKQFTAEQ